MKKRTIIAIIITAVIVFIINKYSNTITLTYPDTLHIRASMKFDFLLFSIIPILAYFLAYKLSNYVSEFSTINAKSRVEIIFLTVFFVFLFIPMLHINQEEKSIQENRYLAKWQPLIKKNGEINYDFGKNFNEWFNDRFCLREKLIKIFYVIKACNRMVETDIALGDLRNKIFWYKPQLNGTYYKISKSELSRDADNLKRLKSFCIQHNIKLYLIVVPQKVNIYNEQLIYRPQNTIPVGEQLKSITKKYNISYIYPKEELLNLKKQKAEYIYYKTDTHLTDYGMYNVALSFINYAKKDFPQLEAIKLENYSWKYNKYVNPRYANDTNFVGDMLRETVNDEKYLDVQYKDYDTYPNEFYKIPDSKFYEAKIDNKNPKNKINSFVIGSSYASKFIKMLSPSVNKTYKIEQNFFRDNKITYDMIYPKILSNDTKILILIFNEGDAQLYLGTMYGEL